MADTQYLHPNNTFIVSSGYHNGQLIRYQYYNNLADAITDASAGTMIVSYDPIEDYVAKEGVQIVFLRLFDEDSIVGADNADVGNTMKVVPDPESPTDKVWVAKEVMETITYVILYFAGSDELSIAVQLDTTGRGCDEAIIPDAISANSTSGFTLYPAYTNLVSLVPMNCMIPVIDTSTHALRGYIIADGTTSTFKVYNPSFLLTKLDEVLEDTLEYYFSVTFKRT